MSYANFVVFRSLFLHGGWRCSLFHLGEACATTTDLDPISPDSLYRWMPRHGGRQMHKELGFQKTSVT